MKEKKKKRKILATLIPVLIFLLAVALLAQGGSTKPGAGNQCRQLLKRVSGNRFCLCRI